MEHFSYKDISYEVDEQGFLLNPKFWDKNFSEGMAKTCEIQDLTSEHWEAIRFVREFFEASGVCPTVFASCKATGLRPREMKNLFPTGYHRGLCKIAGVRYLVHREPDNTHVFDAIDDIKTISDKKQYCVDVRGFLVDPNDWDVNYAMHRALEMNIPKGQLTDKHWQIIKYLRDFFKNENKIPTIFETCEKCLLEIDDLESLFPDGYHRGVVKIAGLRFVK
jgi:TusE/DsrC/DsvC family sulfur relay protein